ncbi:flagellar hook-associated protein FlgK [Allohahella marinimesophila]|uniref:Flagellar hook-associated protein 1 n=1 Tax=Allohahella marinimesophila TaxID=1054972 RepID=A0ABP7NTR0_9GAMM
MAGSLLNIGLSGVLAHQTALRVTGNNVANANTEGYTRQRAEFDQLGGQFTGAGYLGSGAQITDIQRLTDSYLQTQVRSDTSVSAEIGIVAENLEQINNLLADPRTGISPALSDFFGALQIAAEDPSSVPARQELLSQSNRLVDRFRLINDRLTAQSSSVETSIRSQVEDVNGLAAAIAETNRSIVSAKGAASGSQPNDLLDKRDMLIKELATKVSINVIPQDDGQLNVFIGKGQALVMGSSSSSIVARKNEDDPNSLEIAIGKEGRFVQITREITGGELGGLIRFREAVLEPAQNNLGRLAISIADRVNDQHQQGMTLENQFGGLYFNDVNSEEAMLARVVGNAANAQPNDRIVSVRIEDTTALKTRDYAIEFTGPGRDDLVVKDATTGATITRTSLGGLYPAKLELDGMAIQFESGSFQPGDRFLIQPTRSGISGLGLVVDRVEDLALAAPIRTESQKSNTGSATISQGSMVGNRSLNTNELLPGFASPAELTPPLVVRFLNETTYEVLDNSDPANPQPLSPPLSNQRYVPGIRNELFSSDPFAVQVAADGTSIGVIQPPQALSLTTPPALLNNGYGAQTISIEGRNPETGAITTFPTVNVPANSTAGNIAAALNGTPGIKASAFTDLQLSNFNDGGTPGSAALRVTIAGTNGQPPYSFEASFADPVADSPAAIADAINADEGMKSLGIVALSDGTSLSLRSTDGRNIQVGLTGAAADGDSVQLTSAGTAVPQTLNNNEEAVVGGQLDVVLEDGLRLRGSNNAIFTPTPATETAFRGFMTSISGTPAKGDAFTIAYNSDGFGDNRNALALLGLEAGGFVGPGKDSFNGAYASFVSSIGAQTNEARADAEAASSLLTQSEGRLDAVAGVNLDEEAAKLIQFQQAYNANAQIVSVARELFDTLLGAVR